MVMLLIPNMVQAANTPTIKSISFTNAKIDEKFESDKFEYGLTLDDPEVTPTLEAYETKGRGNIFITYNEDEAKHQTGVVATLEYENGSVVYTFNYTNPPEYKISSNNNLKSIECALCEVYPAIDEEHTDYKLYIPNDMTEIKLTAVPADTNATCEVPSQIKLSAEQEPTITVTVTASDASTKVYSFQIKRLKKTTKEIEEQMAKDSSASLIEDEILYKNPKFIIIVGGTIGGLLLIIIIVAVIKKSARKAEDEDEEEFFLFEPESKDDKEPNEDNDE